MRWRFVSQGDHGIMDYVISFFLIIIPYYSASMPSGVRWASIAAGISLLWYSLFTKYPNSGWPKIPFKVHLVLDILFAAVLILAVYFSGMTYPQSYSIYAPAAALLVISLLVKKKSKT